MIARRLTLRPAARHLRRLLRDTSGTATVEFVLVVPIFISLIMMSIELGFVTLRHTMLERGLDIAVRDIRLGTGTAPQHDQIKKIICDNALIIADCENSLRLEMRPTDIRNYTPLSDVPDCTDAANPAKPVKQWTPGQQNQLVLMRACLKYNPLFPKEALGSALDKDSSGQAVTVAMTAFVQEPL